MVKFGLAISSGIVNAIVNDPKLIDLWVDVHARHDADALDDRVGIPAVLTPYQFDFERGVEFFIG